MDDMPGIHRIGLALIRLNLLPVSQLVNITQSTLGLDIPDAAMDVTQMPNSFCRAIARGL